MAKTKEKEAKVVQNSDNVIAELEKEFGNVFTSGKDFKDKKKKVIPFSPKNDMMLGGGIPEGTFVILTGKPKTGKTSSCLHFAGIAQQPQYAHESDPEGRWVYFFNIEGRFKTRDLEGITSLNQDRLTVIESVPGNILNAEKYISIGEKLINSKPGAIFIFDSFSQLCTEGEMVANIGDRYRADSPLLLARFCRRIANVIPINKCIVMGITHQIANQGMGHSPWSEASGNKLQYQADVKMRCLFDKAILAGETQVGQEINWVCDTSAIGPPGTKSVSKLRYGYGLDKESELLDICCDLGVIKKGGAWYTFPDESKFQGLEKAADALRHNPELYGQLENNYRDLMGFPKEV